MVVIVSIIMGTVINIPHINAIIVIIIRIRIAIATHAYIYPCAGREKQGNDQNSREKNQLHKILNFLEAINLQEKISPIGFFAMNHKCIK